MDDMRRAVVVEDDRDIGDLISGLLEKAGFEVAVARTGTDALALVRDNAPDLVTLDLTLPDIDGVAATHSESSMYLHGGYAGLEFNY